MEWSKDGLPIIPRLPETPTLPDPNPAVAVCGECGMVLRKIMHYVCFNSRCPTGLGGTKCQS